MTEAVVMKPLTSVAPSRAVGPITTLSSTQVRRGLVLLVGFVGTRAALTWAFSPDRISSAVDPKYLAYIGLAFLLGSFGIVYLGFTRWMRVDLLSWWVDRRHLRGDIVWGLLGLIGGAAVTLSLSLVLVTTGAVPVPPQQAAMSLAEYAVLLVFGFAVASFQEETLFRGFLQTWLAGRYGTWLAILLQAPVFSLAHVGYAPITAWHLYLASFALGLWFGWLRHRRGRLLAPGIAHGLLG